jgi:hypothetical protein
MKADLYACSVRVFERGLVGLAAVLRKGVAHSGALAVSEDEIIGARLYPDMFPLRRQVQIVCDFARQAPSRVLGLEVPAALDRMMDHAELQAQIAAAREFLASLAPSAFEGRDEQAVTFPVGDASMTQSAARYLLGFATPNFYFHLVTAYAILRSRGVPLGKPDYFGVGSP